MLTNFNNSFAVAFADEPQKKLAHNLPPQLKSVAALPCENQMFNCATLQSVIQCKRDAKSLFIVTAYQRH